MVTHPVVTIRENMKNCKFSHWMKFHTAGNLRRFFRGENGAVMMEYVIVAVLIAAACVVAVVVFSRSVGGGFVTSARAVTGKHTEAAQMQKQQQADRAADAEKAKMYSDSMSK